MRMHVAINASSGAKRPPAPQYLHRLIAELAATPASSSHLWPLAHSPRPATPALALSTPVDLLGVDIAKLWFEQVTFAREATVWA